MGLEKKQDIGAALKNGLDEDETFIKVGSNLPLHVVALPRLLWGIYSRVLQLRNALYSSGDTCSKHVHVPRYWNLVVWEGSALQANVYHLCSIQTCMLRSEREVKQSIFWESQNRR